VYVARYDPYIDAVWSIHALVEPLIEPTGQVGPTVGEGPVNMDVVVGGLEVDRTDVCEGVKCGEGVGMNWMVVTCILGVKVGIAKRGVVVGVSSK